MKNKYESKLRTLKVYTKLTLPQFSQALILPEIRLTGKWLKKWGFDCGNEIKVIKTHFGLSIVKIKQEIPIVIL